MLASFYRRLIRLHPPSFREKFGDEMLSIFDHEQRTPETIRLLLDGLLSLTRQWILRTESWHKLDPAPVQSIQGDVPTFSSLDSFRPGTAAITEGLLLSIALFCLTCFAIRYSWIRVLHIRIPEVQLERPMWRPQPPTIADPQSSQRPPSPALQPKQSTPPADATSASAVPAQPVLLPKHRRKRVLAGSDAKTSKAADSNASNQASQFVFANPLAAELFEGTYVVESPRKLTIIITARNGDLALNLAGQPQLVLTQATQTRFAVEGKADCWIDFLPDNDSDQGAPMRQLKLSCNGEQLIARRQ